MADYTPPSPSAIAATLASGYVPPAANNLNFVVGAIQAILCVGDVTAPLDTVEAAATVTIIATGAVSESAGEVAATAESHVVLGNIVEPVAEVSATGESDVEVVSGTGDVVQPAGLILAVAANAAIIGRLKSFDTISGTATTPTYGVGRVRQSATISGTCESSVIIEGVGSIVEPTGSLVGRAQTPNICYGDVRQEVGVVAATGTAEQVSVAHGNVEESVPTVAATATAHIVVYANGTVTEPVSAVTAAANHRIVCDGQIMEPVGRVSARIINPGSSGVLQYQRDANRSGGTAPAAFTPLGFSRGAVVAPTADSVPPDPLHFSR